jgi:hypothetical protein
MMEKHLKNSCLPFATIAAPRASCGSSCPPRDAAAVAECSHVAANKALLRLERLGIIALDHKPRARREAFTFYRILTHPLRGRSLAVRLNNRRLLVFDFGFCLGIAAARSALHVGIPLHFFVPFSFYPFHFALLHK